MRLSPFGASGRSADPATFIVEPSSRDLAVLRQLRQEWLARAGREIEAARVIAQAPGCPDPSTVITYLQQTLNAAADATCLAPQDRTTLAQEARSVARIACQRALEDLLEKGHAMARGQASGKLPRLLEKAGELVARLEQLQLDRPSCDRLRAKLDILQQTNAAGVSAKAKVEEAINTRPFLRDQRLFVRYVEPVLLVRLAGGRYRTRNWSLGGVLLTGVARMPGTPGMLVDLQFSVENGPSYADRATLLRFDEARRELALQLRRFGSTMVTLRQSCEAHNLLRS